MRITNKERRQNMNHDDRKEYLVQEINRKKNVWIEKKILPKRKENGTWNKCGKDFRPGKKIRTKRIE